MASVRITEDNPAIETLRRSWATSIYTDEDGLGAMASLHEAGDAIVAVAALTPDGPLVLGSGVMVGPGLALLATHVLEEFSRQGLFPVLLSFLPKGTRAWCVRDTATASGPSVFHDDRIVSDISLVSCTLNSEAHPDVALRLAPMRVALPLLGDRLWAFGYRHDHERDAVAHIAPLVTSGVVTAQYPNGRGERMPASCVEVDMNTLGGMSGGPVVNADGELVGIVSSSLDGGPSFVTLIWDALRYSVQSTLSTYSRWGDMNLLSAKVFGLVRLEGNVRRSRRGNVAVSLSDIEAKEFAAAWTADPSREELQRVKPLGADRVEVLNEAWGELLEDAGGNAAMEYLERRPLVTVREILATAGVPDQCTATIRAFSVLDFEGTEDPEFLGAWDTDTPLCRVSFAFELLSVVWTIWVDGSDYRANQAAYEANFINVSDEGECVSMERVERLYFETEILLDPTSGEIDSTAITWAGIVHRRTRPRPAKHSDQ
jgi:hypothetical protein